MKIGILTWGSNGDVRPFIALASGLGARGHQVTLHIANADKGDYSAFSRLKNVTLHILPVAKRLPAQFQDMEDKLERTRTPLGELELVLEELYDPMQDILMESAYALCAANDLVIGHCVVHELTIAAQKTKTPRVSVMLAPMMPTRYIVPGDAPYLGKTANLLMWKLVMWLMHHFQKNRINTVREREGVKPVKDVLTDAWLSPLLNLVAVSPSLIPPPHDWEEQHKVTGFLKIDNEDEQWQLPDDLKKFLQDGITPVFIGFGSMMTVSSRTEETMALLEDAVTLAGCRAIIQVNATHKRKQKNNNPNVYWLGKAPHRELFPHCALVVHHGGAGTTQAATLAGRPQVVVTHIADQPFWATVLERIGISAGHVNARKLTAKKLAWLMLNALDNPDYQKTASIMAAQMQSENGVENAIREIEKIIGDTKDNGAGNHNDNIHSENDILDNESMAKIRVNIR